MSLFGPCEPIRDLNLHGDAVASVLGVLPTSLHHACGVFVDPRDIGFPVALIVLPPLPYTLTGVLELLRIPRPQELAFSLHGVDLLVGHPAGFRPKHSAVIRLFRASQLSLTPDDVASADGIVDEAVPLPSSLPAVSAAPPGGSEVRAHSFGTCDSS